MTTRTDPIVQAPLATAVLLLALLIGAGAAGSQPGPSTAGGDAPVRPEASEPRKAPPATGAGADTFAVREAETIIVRRTRVDDRGGVPFADLSGADLEHISYGQDVPMVLASLPSTYAFSDAGDGFGYSYLRIRGFDQSRIGMLLNGVPLNDPESHQVYWVDHGDVLSGAGSVQVQRGVGATLFGQQSFGGSVDVLTSPLTARRGLQLETGYSTFTGDADRPTRSHRAAFATGPIAGGKLALYARYSRLDGEGYRDRSSLDQESFGLSALYRGGAMSHKLDVLSGKELTHFTWDGVSPDAPVREEDRESQRCYEIDLDDRDARRCNRYSIYSNNVDDFRQIVTSITSERAIGGDLHLTNTLYHVTGEGFFEQLELDESLFDYGIDPIVVDDSTTITTTDLVRRRWLQNRYWGLLPQLDVALGSGSATIGAGVRRYVSDHFGELVWTDENVPADPLARYYHNDTDKLSFEAYARVSQPLGARSTLVTSLRYQGHRYDFVQRRIGNFRGYEFEADHDFVSPRAALTHRVSDVVTASASLGYAEREPSVHDYIDEDDPSSVPAFEGADVRTTGLDEPIPRSEKILDVELGLEARRERWHARAGVYQLELRDELIPIDGGRILEEGQLRRANAGKTRHQGVELDARVMPSAALTIRGNVSLARHRFVDHEIFAYWLDDYTGGALRFDGNTIPRSPEVLANLLVSWSSVVLPGAGRVHGLTLGAEIRHAGRQYIEAENVDTNAIDPFTLVNVSAEYDLANVLGSPQRLALKLRVTNLFDTLHETSGYSYYDDFPARQLRFYWPGATRSLRVGMEAVL